MFSCSPTQVRSDSQRTLIYGISRDGSKNVNIHTCEHMILGQLRKGVRQTKNTPLFHLKKKNKWDFPILATPFHLHGNFDEKMVEIAPV